MCRTLFPDQNQQKKLDCFGQQNSRRTDYEMSLVAENVDAEEDEDGDDRDHDLDSSDKSKPSI